MPEETKGVRSSRVEVIDCCELPDEGTGNRTQGSYENSMLLTAKPFFSAPYGSFSLVFLLH